MKTAIFYGLPLRADHVFLSPDVREVFLRLEILFWRMATDLMPRNRFIRFLVRFFYNVMQEKPISWVVKLTIALSVLSFLVGLLFSLVIASAPLLRILP
jgi:hypothetical protein